MSKFTDSSEGVAAALRAGVALEAAADAEGVSASTVRAWLRRGKREPESEFGEFVRSAEPAEDGEAPMTVAELEKHLVRAIRRKGSVAAAKLWLEIHRQDDGPTGDDPLAAFLPGSSNGRA